MRNDLIILSSAIAVGIFRAGIRAILVVHNLTQSRAMDGLQPSLVLSWGSTKVPASLVFVTLLCLLIMGFVLGDLARLIRAKS